MNDNNGWGGAVGILVLLIALGAMQNGNGGGIFGGGNTAADTAALVEQNNTARQVAANQASLSNLLERTGGIAEATVRGFDNVGNMLRETDTKLCQLGSNIAMGQRDIIQSQKDCCCATQSSIDRGTDRVLHWLNDNRDREQLARIATLEAEKSNYKQTEELKAWARAEFGCKPSCGVSTENSILLGMLNQMQSLVTSVATIASKFTPTTA